MTALPVLDESSIRFYRHALSILKDAGVKHLVGGAYAFARYTGIERHTKDFDIFIRREDYGRAAWAFQKAGYKTALGVIALENILRDIENTEWARKYRDSDLYYVTIFGKPAMKGSWGWRIEGHHLSLNYEKGDDIVNVWSAYYESQYSGNAAHSPLVCIPGGGWVVQDGGVTEIQVAGGPGLDLGEPDDPDREQPVAVAMEHLP